MKAKVGVVFSAVSLLVCGLLISHARAALSKEMHSLIKGSKLVILPHSGHMTFVDQRVLFHEAVEGFLQPEVK
jgi:pimeloyl-ACP methyl ester carboxylesterase